jgi:hypothetical protein
MSRVIIDLVDDSDDDEDIMVVSVPGTAGLSKGGTAPTGSAVAKSSSSVSNEYLMEQDDDDDDDKDNDDDDDDRWPASGTEDDYYDTGYQDYHDFDGGGSNLSAPSVATAMSSQSQSQSQSQVPMRVTGGSTDAGMASKIATTGSASTKRPRNEPTDPSESKEAKALARATSKAAAKQASKAERDHRDIGLGKWRCDEIAMVVSTSLRDTPLDKAIKALYAVQDGARKEQEAKKKGSSAVKQNLLFPYSILYHDAVTPNIIRWTHRSASLGGHGNIGEPNVTVLGFVSIVYSVFDFERIARQTPDLIDFPALGREIQQIQRTLTTVDQCPADVIFSFTLTDVKQSQVLYAPRTSGQHTLQANTLLCVCAHQMHIKNMTSCDLLSMFSFPVSRSLRSVTPGLPDTRSKRSGQWQRSRMTPDHTSCTNARSNSCWR